MCTPPTSHVSKITLDIVRLLVGEAQADVDKAKADGVIPLFFAVKGTWMS